MDGAHVPDQIPHKLAMRWYGPYEVLEVFAGGGTVRLRLPEELGRMHQEKVLHVDMDISCQHGILKKIPC